MTSNAVRITTVCIAVAAFAAVSLATDHAVQPGARGGDPSVPSARDVLRDNDGRSEGNSDDKTF